MISAILLTSTLLGASPTDFSGNWDVKLVANYSSCKDRNAGDALSEQWQISAANGDLSVKVTSSSKEAKTYKGQVKSDGSLVFNAGPEIGVELTGNSDYLQGRRVVASHSGLAGNCAIIYDLHANKTK